MRLYTMPGACSLAANIALREAGVPFDIVKISHRTHKSAEGVDISEVNSKGYVPALSLDNGELLTENAALLPYIDYSASKQQPKLPAEFIVWLAPHGVITDKTMFNSSGNAEWDMAASLALRNAYRLPPDDDGRVPYQAIVSMSPARLFATAVNVPRPGLGGEDRPTYGEKIAAKVRQHVVFPDAAQLPGNPGAEFDVRLDTDGSIKTVDLTKSSGYSDWDVAARRALLKTETFPLDVSGKAPPRIFITMRPKL